jgi:peptide/nickel transport system substrate-binding protein
VYAAIGTPESYDLEQQDDGLVEQLASACYGGDIVRNKVVYSSQYHVDIADVLAPGNSGIANGLAEAFEVSPDETEYTFYLRTNAKSSLGNPLTADDVIYSVTRQMALQSGGAYFDGIMGITTPDMKKLDDHTVRFTLAQPSPLFLKIDAMKYFGGLFDSVAAKAHATSSDPWSKQWLASHTAGFDAYYASSIIQGRQLVLNANPGWYGGTPAYDQIVWSAIPSPETRLALLVRGEADVVLDLTPEQVKSIAGIGGVTVASYVGNGLQSIVLDIHSGPLQDVRVRQAMAYAIPYADILSSVWLGTAQPLRSPVPPSFPGSTDQYWPYGDNGDMDMARKLMKDANQGPFTISLTYDSTNTTDPLTAPIIQLALSEIGINVVLDPTTTALTSDAANNVTAAKPAVMFEPHPYIADPAYCLWAYWYSKSGANHNHFSDPTYDALVEAALVQPDFEKRVKLGMAAQKVWLSQMPYLLLATVPWNLAHRDTVGGTAWFPDGWIRFQNLNPT